MLESADASPDLWAASTCGVDICEGFGVGGLPYTAEGWKGLGVEKCCGMA